MRDIALLLAWQIQCLFVCVSPNHFLLSAASPRRITMPLQDCKAGCGFPQMDGLQMPNNYICQDIILELTSPYCCICCFMKHEFAELYVRNKFQHDHGGKCNSRRTSTTDATGVDGASRDDTIASFVHLEPNHCQLCATNGIANFAPLTAMSCTTKTNFSMTTEAGAAA